jgi:hypothetical protein
MQNVKNESESKLKAKLTGHEILILIKWLDAKDRDSCDRLFFHRYRYRL